MGNKAVLAGGLEFIPLADLFQILGGNNATGRLKITSQYAPDSGVIYFQDGDLINAKVGALGGVKAVYSLFGWTEGQFEFVEEKVRVGRKIKNSRMQIVLDALRLLDDGKIEMVGPTSPDQALAGQGAETGKGKKEVMPVMKGPLVDYVLVISEDSFPNGHQIVKEGGYGRWIWVILEGEVKITRETPEGSLTLARLGEGCFVGAFTSLLHDRFLRSASVTASGDVTLGVLDADSLTREFASLSPDFKMLLQSLDSRLKKINDAAVSFFLNEPPTEPLPKEGKLIIERGASREDLFAIMGGKAYVVGQAKKETFPLLALEQNDIFGFLPFMDIGNEPKFASILGDDGLEIREVDAEALRKEYEGLSGTFRNFIYSVGTCISMTTSLAFHLKTGK